MFERLDPAARLAPTGDDPTEKYGAASEFARISKLEDPGFGEIDHYRLLNNVAFTGRAMPLCCENISAPKFRPTKPEEIDALARRAREFLELVIHGLQS